MITQLNYRLSERPKGSTTDKVIMRNLACVRTDNQKLRRCNVVLKNVKPVFAEQATDHE